MTATLLREIAGAGCRLRLNAAGDGLTVGPPEAMTPELRQTITAGKPALVRLLRAERDQRAEVASLLRALRRLTSEAAPAGLTLHLAPAGSAKPLLVRPSAALVPPELAQRIKALAAPLQTYLLTRELFGPAEVAWRVDAMRRQLRAWRATGIGASEAPFLRAESRPDWPRYDRCFSCRWPLDHDPGWDATLMGAEARYGRNVRCTDCHAAVEHVQSELGVLECYCWCGTEVYRLTESDDPLCALHDDIPYCPACRQRPVAADRWRLGPTGIPRHRLCPICHEQREATFEEARA